MSADGQRKAYRYTCNMVRPQIYSEKSLMESVVDFFSDVVPQAYSSTQKVEDKEKIQWVRFETCDCNDISKNPDLYRSDTKGLPLLLILGYSNGVQIWHVTSNGEAQEILSIRQGPVRIFRILPIPDTALGYQDGFISKRPLAVMCDSSSAGQPYCGIKFVSLKTGDEVHSINYKTLPVQTIECNKRFLAVVFLEKICVYEACRFQQLFWVTSCYPCTGPTVNPMALSTRWLAYADKRLVAMHQSCGGMSGDGAQSYAATVISAAKGAFKGLSMFGEAMVNSVTGCKTPGVKKQDFVHIDNGNRPGIVTVVDIQTVHNDHFNVNEDNEGSGLIAHFHAHANEPVANMAFDSTGTLLVTACKLGHNFHVFRLMAHPCTSSLGAVHHLYTLHRGDTTAKVTDISFNHDSRWVTVSTHRGTTHIFPITPYGGPINVRTHCQPHIVNRASRFHKSAGLEEIERSPMGRRSPVLSTSPGSSGQYDKYPTLIQQNTLNNNMGNPRLPPYPHPITIYPLYQIKQPLNVVLNPSNKNQSPSHSPTGTDNVYHVCAVFSSPRLCVIGSPKLDMDRRESGRRPVDSLFIMTQSGSLVEYVLEPKARVVLDKVTEDCTLDLAVVGRMQWNLQRLKASQELRPPLPSNSPLLLATEAVLSQIPTAADLCDHIGLTRQDSKDSLSSDHSNKEDDEQWLSQVEIITHAGPHRRLWMGPQFSFKTYQENTTVLSSNSSALLSQSPETNLGAMDITGEEGDLESLKVQPTRSNPVTMPTTRPAYRRLSGSDSSPSPGLGQITPLMIEAGSFDQSPHLLDVYSNWTESTVEKQPRGSDDIEEDRLKQTLADAMVESPIKDIDKLSLRQDITRSRVTSGKKKNKSGALQHTKDMKKAEEVVKELKEESVTSREVKEFETVEKAEDVKAAKVNTPKGNKKASRQKTDGKGKDSRAVETKESEKQSADKESNTFGEKALEAEKQGKALDEASDSRKSMFSCEVSLQQKSNGKKTNVTFKESQKENEEKVKGDAGKKTGSSKDKKYKPVVEVSHADKVTDLSKNTSSSSQLNNSVAEHSVDKLNDNSKAKRSQKSRKSPDKLDSKNTKEDAREKDMTKTIKSGETTSDKMRQSDREESPFQTKKISDEVKSTKHSAKSKSARKRLSDSYIVKDNPETLFSHTDDMKGADMDVDDRQLGNDKITPSSGPISSVSSSCKIKEEIVSEVKSDKDLISGAENKHEIENYDMEPEIQSLECCSAKESVDASPESSSVRHEPNPCCESSMSISKLPLEPKQQKQTDTENFHTVKDMKKKKKKNAKKVSEPISSKEDMNCQSQKIEAITKEEQHDDVVNIDDTLPNDVKTHLEKEEDSEYIEEQEVGECKSLEPEIEAMIEGAVSMTIESSSPVSRTVLDNNSNNQRMEENPSLSSKQERKTGNTTKPQLEKTKDECQTMFSRVEDNSDMLVVKSKKSKKKKIKMEESQYFDTIDQIKDEGEDRENTDKTNQEVSLQLLAQTTSDLPSDPIDANCHKKSKPGEKSTETEDKAIELVKNKESTIEPDTHENEMFVVKSKRKKKKKKSGMEESVYDIKMDNNTGNTQECEQSIYVEASAVPSSNMADTWDESFTDSSIPVNLSQEDKTDCRKTVEAGAEGIRNEIEEIVTGDKRQTADCQSSCEEMVTETMLHSKNETTPMTYEAECWETAAMDDVVEDSIQDIELEENQEQLHLKASSSSEPIETTSGTSLANPSDRSSEERDSEQKKEISSERSSEEREVTVKSDIQKSEGKSKKKKRKNRK